MTIDSNLVREAQEILQLYSRPAQELIKQNLYGPREARLAGAIVANSFTVVSYQEPTEAELLKTWQAHARDQFATLRDVMQKLMNLVEDRLAGSDVQALLDACEDELASVEEDFGSDDEVEAGPKQDVFVVVFPPLDERGQMAETSEIRTFVEKLTGRAITTWVANENDQSRRLKAMTMREIYNVGRVAAVVLTNKDGVVLDGWYNGMPWIEEVLNRVRELHA